MYVWKGENKLSLCLINYTPRHEVMNARRSLVLHWASSWRDSNFIFCYINVNFKYMLSQFRASSVFFAEKSGNRKRPLLSSLWQFYSHTAERWVGWGRNWSPTLRRRTPTTLQPCECGSYITSIVLAVTGSWTRAQNVNKLWSNAEDKNEGNKGRDRSKEVGFTADRLPNLQQSETDSHHRNLIAGKKKIKRVFICWFRCVVNFLRGLVMTAERSFTGLPGTTSWYTLIIPLL
jgi:hypothetical protein